MGFLSPSDWSNAFGSDNETLGLQVLMQMQQREREDALRAQQRADLAPYMQLGQWGAGELGNYLQNGYDPNQDQGYARAKSQLGTDMNRQLRALGRSNSTYGINAYTRGLNDLYDTYQNKRYNQLMGATNVGQGTASTAVGATNNAANNSANMYQSMLGQLNQNAFNSQQRGYNNLASGMNALGTGMNIYDWGKQNGWWGGGGGNFQLNPGDLQNFDSSWLNSGNGIDTATINDFLAGLGR